MIQILIHIISYIMALIMSLFPAKPPVETGPTVVDINGVKYKNCFLSDSVGLLNYYDVVGSYDDSIKPIYVDAEGKEYYTVNDSMIVQSHHSPTNTNPFTQVYYYCPENEWETLRAYYWDLENWNCKVSGWYKKEINGELVLNEVDLSLENLDPEKWHQIMAFEASSDRNVNSNYIEYKTGESHPTTVSIKISMRSKDELFGRTTGFFCSYYQDEKMYYVATSVGNLYDVVYEMPADLQAYLMELIGMDSQI